MGRPPVVWDPSYEVDLGPHVFVTAKYRLTRDALLAAGTVTKNDFVSPVPATRARLELVHTEAYLRKIETDDFTMGERLALEIPFTDEVRSAMILSCGGTIDTCRLALEHGAAAHLGGGFHHAFADHGEGFCLLNDIAIAVRVLLEEGMVEAPMVLDLDVHHGNGTAAILASEERAYTISFHQQNNYPAVKPPSSLDVGFEDGVGDEEYIRALEEALPAALSAHDPDFMLYLAGADPYRDDQLGGLKLTRDGLRARDRRVFELAAELGAPVAVVLAGGYAYRLDDTVAIHAGTVEELVGRRLSQAG